MITYTSFGGAGNVTGSKHLLSINDKKILIDCGMFQGLKNLRELNWKRLPIDPSTIDAVILTHAHLDHSGYLPRLVKDGFKGKIYASHATKDLAKVILLDSAYLQEKDAEYANKKGFSKHKPAIPLYTVEDAEKALGLICGIDFHQSIEIYKNIHLTLKRAGHILGASIAEIDTSEKKIVFSGDLGRNNDEVMYDPEPIKSADYLFIESTYGDRTHDSADVLTSLLDIIDRTTKRGGTVVIPAFAVGRAQTLIYDLWKLKKLGHLVNVPIYLDSPMAMDATALLIKHRKEHKIPQDELVPAFSSITYIKDVEQSKALTKNAYPKIIISSSGMASGGRVLHHITAYGRSHLNSIVFSGYQALGTRGRKLIEGEREVKIHGKWIKINAEIKELPMLSAHADCNELINWLNHFDKKPSNIFIVHGEAEASDSLRIKIERELGYSASVPRINEEYILN